MHISSGKHCCSAYGRPGPHTMCRLCSSTFIVCLLAAGSLLHVASGHAGHTDKQSQASGRPVRSSRRNAQLNEITDEAYFGSESSALVGVFSSGQDAKYAARRTLIRQTWGQFISKESGLALWFVISDKNLTISQRAAVLKESQASKDIVLLQDTFNGKRGGKLFDFLLWSVKVQPDVKFIVKLDQDVWLHPFNLKRLLITLPRQLTYWGQIREETDVTYMAGHMLVVSTDMVQWLAGRRSDIDAALAKLTRDADTGKALGVVLAWSPISLSAMRAWPAAGFEIYDWGPDKQPGASLAEADQGFPAPETIAVHALKRSSTYKLLHEYFVSSLLRWKACAAGKFEVQMCHEVLNMEQSLSC